jgi:hypothetical protein
MLAQLVIDKLYRAANPARHADQPPAFPHDGPTDPRIGRANRVLWRCRVNRETGCWEWKDAVSSKGYGRVKFGGRLLLPHRVVAVAAGILKGATEAEDPRLVLHECDNARCCNPAHLKAGTQSQNMKDCVARGRWRLLRD